MEHKAPILQGHVPFCFDVPDGQEDGFFRRLIVEVYAPVETGSSSLLVED